MVATDYSMELSDELENAHFQEAIEKAVVTLEKSNGDIFGQEEVVCLLFDGTLCNFRWGQFILQTVPNLEGKTKERDLDVEARPPGCCE